MDSSNITDFASIKSNAKLELIPYVLLYMWRLFKMELGDSSYIAAPSPLGLLEIVKF